MAQTSTICNSDQLSNNQKYDPGEPNHSKFYCMINHKDDAKTVISQYCQINNVRKFRGIPLGFSGVQTGN